MSRDRAKIFMHGRSQAVRLPKEFRLPGKECRVRREGKAVILEPIEEPFDVEAWWARIDALRDGHEFLPEGVPEPELPADEIDLDANGDVPGGNDVR